MLESTFIHLPGIGAKKERALWEQGIRTWDDLERASFRQADLFRPREAGSVPALLAESRAALARGDMDFFARRLPGREHYRIALTLPGSTAFLDVETTGLSIYYDYVTIVGVGLAGEYYCHVRGGSKAALARLLSGAACLVTFNGSVFDTKFMEREFPDVKLPEAHVDLRFFGRSVGLVGNQKAIERSIRVDGRSHVADVDGAMAPVLWYQYQMGDSAACKTLIEYNHADIVGMQVILDEAIRRKAADGVAHVLRTPPPRFLAKPRRLAWAASRKAEAGHRIYVPPYRGAKGPRTTYGQLMQGVRERPLRVVGIDLTGSEARASGWCLLTDDYALTQRIGSDLDLISETVCALPHVVSIDSPLSLPYGRTRTTDDDPAREEFGITRECERLLRARGVHVYPTLILNMQGLTARGIRLATHFRKLGIPVIESYPGAAQDILGIPRKKKGLEHLTRALLDFGVRGPISSDKLSHDELDAVTSALVGLFFWTGKFEGLGNDQEEYLIVPDLARQPGDWLDRRVVGVSGETGAGKTTVARFLEGRGYAYGRFSQVLEDELRKDGRPVTGKALQDLGAQIHEDPGQRWLCRRLKERLPSEGKVVIDGLRFPEDHAFQVETYGPAFVHVHVTRDRGRQDGPSPAKTSAKGSGREQTLRHPSERGVAMLGELAHVRVENDRAKDDLHAEVLERLLSLGVQDPGGRVFP